MTDFLLLSRRVGLEADLPFKSESPSAIEKIYNEKYSGKLVAWSDESLGKCGCVYFYRSATAETSDLEYVSIYELKPAKSWGHVGITLNSKEGRVVTTLFSSRHSEESLVWLKATQEKLVAFFNLKPKYEDHGYDV